jgi:hypothetical protein
MPWISPILLAFLGKYRPISPFVAKQKRLWAFVTKDERTQK